MKITLQSGRITLTMLVVLLVEGALLPLMAADEPIVLLEPYRAESTVESISSRQKDQDYLKRHGSVLILIHDLLSENISTISYESENGREKGKSGLVGAKMLLSFFEDASFTVTVEGERHTLGNGFSFQGRQEGAPFSSFSMTVADGNYIISFQDFNSGMIYRTVGSTDTGIGTVREIDPGKLPPVYDSEPIVPPQE